MRTWLAVLSVGGHLGAKRDDLFRERVARRIAEPHNPVIERCHGRFKQSFRFVVVKLQSSL